RNSRAPVTVGAVTDGHANFKRSGEPPTGGAGLSGNGAGDERRRTSELIERIASSANADSIVADLRELTEVEDRLDDLLLFELEKKPHRKDSRLAFVRALGLLGDLCHPDNSEKLARVLLRCDPAKESVLTLAILDVLAAMRHGSNEVVHAVAR